MTICWFWIMLKHSNENAENVVKPPKNPISNIGLNCGNLVATTPAKNPPLIFTTNVATGNPIMGITHKLSK